jgi:hypothetical protein
LPVNWALYSYPAHQKELGLNFRITSVILLFIFSGYTLFTMSIAEQSLLSFGYQLISSPDTAQVLLDLYIMAFLAICWMYRDVKSRGKSIGYFIPFALLTLIFVSIGPLLYLVLKPTTDATKI